MSLPRSSSARKTAFFTDGKGAPMDIVDSPMWYHGSPTLLTTLAAGSAITRNKDLAKAFSHKPSLLAFSDDGTIRHNGTMEGYIYEIDEPVTQADAHVHPGIVQSDAWEWTTDRDLKLRLIERTQVEQSEKLGCLKAALMGLGTRLTLFLRGRLTQSLHPESARRHSR